MTMALKRVALVAILAAAVLVPAAAASAGNRHAHLRLGLVPLQTAQLGPAGKSFTLNYGSGPLAGDGSFISSSGGGSGGQILVGGGSLGGRSEEHTSELQS